MLTLSKLVLGATVGAILWSGCTAYDYQLPNNGGRIRGASLMWSKEIDSVTVQTNGTVTLKGYSSKADGEETGKLLGTAIKYSK